jgi:drug/metabolite transporter (DMT)-like permease
MRFLLPLSLLVAILAVSTSSIFVRFAQREAPSLVIAALRLAIASLVLAPLALARYRSELRSLTRTDWALGLLSGVLFAAHFATWITSLEYTSVASSVVLVSTGPLWVALLSPLVLREPLTRPVLLGMSLALLGGTVIGLGSACTGRSETGGWTCPPFLEFVQGRAFTGNFLALAGAWTVAGYLLIGRKLRASITLIPYIFIVYSGAAVCLLVVMMLAGESPVGYSPAIYLWILLLALLPQLVSHTIYNWALHYLPAALVSITTLAEPLGAALLAYWILHETPARPTVFGGVLILAGIYLAAGTIKSG